MYKIIRELIKQIVIIVSMALFISFLLLVFDEYLCLIYEFKIQNYLMILLLLILFIMYYRNFYRFFIQILYYFIGICLGINLTGWLITDKYIFVGIKALRNNYYQVLIVSAILFIISLIILFIISFFMSKGKNREISRYINKIMDDKMLYDNHKYDAEYICKFIFESHLRTLGVSGRYGMGKTIIMNKIIDITNSIRNIYVTISPLSCNVEEIPTYIVGQIEKVLKDRGIYTNNTRQIINTIQNGFLSSIINFVDGNQTISNLYENLRESICKLDIKLTIIVDDLDRIYDKEQIQTIFIILDSIISDNCKVIYLYDSFKLNTVFEKDGGSKYIEKYIQDEYILKDLTFRDLVKIENDDYLKKNNTPLNNNIHKIIDDEIGCIEYGTKIYQYSSDDLKFDDHKLTPRLINKIIQMTYEKLSDTDYLESIKGYERFVFRFHVFAFYFQDFKQQIIGKNNPSLYFTFKYNDEEISLEQVLGKFFKVGVYTIDAPSIEECSKEYIDFVHTEDNAEKMLALDLLGYNIDSFISYIKHRNRIDVAESAATQNEIAYNRQYVNLSYDDIYNGIMFNNDKIASIVANLVNMSNSEYTNHERFIKDFREKVLNKEDKLEALKNYKPEKFKNNMQSIYIVSQDKFTSIFNSFKNGNAKDVYWNDLMELYYKYLIKDDKIVFSDIVLTNINLFGFVNYRASIYAFMIISKFSFEDFKNQYIDIPSIPKVMILIKEFLENNFGIRTIFPYPEQEKYYKMEHIDKLKEYLQTFRDYLFKFITHLDDIEDILKNKFEKDLSYIRVALEKLIELIDNASNYEDTIKRVNVKSSFKSIPIDISKYQGKSKEEIDKMFDEDLDNGILRPKHYTSIMKQYEKDKEEDQNGN